MSDAFEKLSDKIYYKNNDVVRFEMGNTTGFGWVKGIAHQHIIDHWIVQVDFSSVNNIDKKVYPYDCIVVPHICMSLQRPVEWSEEESS